MWPRDRAAAARADPRAPVDDRVHEQPRAVRAAARTASTSSRARSWCARTTAVSRTPSAPQIEDAAQARRARRHRRRPARSSSASTWARSISCCWSSRRARSRAVCSASGAPATRVGEVSKGRLFPKHRGDLLEATVVARAHARRRDRSAARAATIRSTCWRSRSWRWSRSSDWRSPSSSALVRRSANFRDLPRDALIAVLDMLAGRYPVARVRRSAAAPGVGSRARRARRRGAARRWSRWSTAARSRIAASTACTSATAARGSASSTRRWCTRPCRARCSCSARRAGAIERITRDRVIVVAGAGRAGQAAVLARRGPGPADRARPRARRVRARARGAAGRPTRARWLERDYQPRRARRRAT